MGDGVLVAILGHCMDIEGKGAHCEARCPGLAWAWAQVQGPRGAAGGAGPEGVTLFSKGKSEAPG